MGPAEAIGTGMIPFDSIGSTTGQQGVPGAFDIAKVRHEPTGGWSTLQFRSYDQGRKAFQGTERDVVWLDEEPPRDVYDECLLRTMTTGGIVLATFTPLNGLSEVAMMFLPELQAGLNS
jgi:phage terminase large subunit-like protein